MQRTFEVEHSGTHYPTDEQLLAGLREALLAEGLKLDGSPEFLVVENTSNGPSKARATFEASPRTKTVGGRKPKAGETGTMTVGGESPDPTPEEGGKIDAAEVLTSD